MRDTNGRIIVEQTGRYSIRHATWATSKGFEVYRDEATGSTRCAVIGYDGDKGLQRARLEVQKRINSDDAHATT